MIKKVDNGQSRHKCSICGRVRFEKFMEVMRHIHSEKYILKTRYGNQCWVCVDNPDCQHKMLFFRPY